jgi:hypothetical protein
MKKHHLAVLLIMSLFCGGCNRSGESPAETKGKADEGGAKAEKGDAEALPTVGSILILPPLLAKAEKGDAKAQDELGVYYRFAAPKNMVEAVKWFRKAAEQGYVEAQDHLAECYENGESVPKDQAEALNWYRKAAEQYRKDAAQGDDDYAKFNLGVHYHKGRGVPKDMVKALKLYRITAELGVADAQNSLGRCYMEGDGVPKDAVEAYKWFNLSGAQGNEMAASDRANLEKTMLPEQIGEAQKLSRAWSETTGLHNAADLGDAYSQVRLGIHYAAGKGVPKNEAEALKWFRKAAEQGYVKAQLELGNCYEFGDGAPENAVEALKWYSLAAAQGDDSASKCQASIEKTMTREQIVEAQKLSRDWKPRISQ